MSETYDTRRRIYLPLILLWILSSRGNIDPHLCLKMAIPDPSLVSSTYVDYCTTRKNGQPGEYRGSTEGGTLLWIYGHNFAPRDFNTTSSMSMSNRVQFYQDDSPKIYDCTMYSDEISTTQLACYTPSMPEGAYRLRIFVNDIALPSSAYRRPQITIFESSRSATPSISNISPGSGLPQRLITLTGDFKTSCYSRDVQPCLNDGVSLISR